MPRGGSGGSFLVGLVGGALAGAAAGLLLAPKAGKEARQIIREKGGEYLDRGGDYATTVRDRIRRRRTGDEITDRVDGNEES